MGFRTGSFIGYMESNLTAKWKPTHCSTEVKCQDGPSFTVADGSFGCNGRAAAAATASLFFASFWSLLPMHNYCLRSLRVLRILRTLRIGCGRHPTAFPAIFMLTSFPHLFCSTFAALCPFDPQQRMSTKPLILPYCRNAFICFVVMIFGFK